MVITQRHRRVEVEVRPGVTVQPFPRRPIDYRITLFLITAFGLGIRLLIVRGFWLDEATSGYDSRLSYPHMLQALRHDNHPPLEYTILWLVAHTVGSTQTDLRLPSILFGTLFIPMLFLAGRSLYDTRVGLLAASYGAVGALAVWYAQEARMYALFMLLATASIWAQRRALTSDRMRYWLAWFAACTAMMWNQWFAALVVLAEVLFAIVVIRHERAARPRKRRARRLVLSVVGMTACVGPILPLLYVQYHNNQANGLGLGSGAPGATLSPYGILNNLVWATFGYHSNSVIAGAVAVWPLGLLAALAVLGRGRSTRRANCQLLITGLLPMLIVFVASGSAASGRSLFEVRYFIALVPVLYLLLAGAAWHLTPNSRVRLFFTTATCAALAVGLVLQQTDSADPRLYGYTGAFAAISADAKPGAEILYAPAYLNVDVEYFAPKVRSGPVSSTVPTLAAATQVFVVGSFNFSGANQAATKHLIAALSKSRHLVRTIGAPNVFVWEFS